MDITLHPMRSDTSLTLEKTGDVLTVNGEVFDFTNIPDGATLPRDAVAADWLAADVQRVNGTLELAIIFPHGAKAPHEALFPAPIIAPPDGPISLPTPNIEPVSEGI
jgi:hypothetical protein